MLDPGVISVAIPVFAKHCSPRRPLNDELFRPHEFLLEVCVSISNPHSVNGPVTVDEDIVIVERGPRSVRHDTIVGAINLGRDLASDHAVVDFGLEPAPKVMSVEILAWLVDLDV